MGRACVLGIALLSHQTKFPRQKLIRPKKTRARPRGPRRVWAAAAHWMSPEAERSASEKPGVRLFCQICANVRGAKSFRRGPFSALRSNVVPGNSTTICRRFEQDSLNTLCKSTFFLLDILMARRYRSKSDSGDQGCPAGSLFGSGVVTARRQPGFTETTEA